MHRIGTIPFDLKDDLVALMFVTSQTRGRWILPKGLAKAGESHAQACLRESMEEAGVGGVVLEDFPMTVTVKSEMCWIICLDAAPPRWVSRGRFVPRILRSVRL